MKFKASSLLPTPIALLIGTEAGFETKFEPDDPGVIDTFEFTEAVADIQKISLAGGSIEDAKKMFSAWTRGLSDESDYEAIEQIFDITKMEIKGELIRKVSDMVADTSKATGREKLEAARVVNEVMNGRSIGDPEDTPGVEGRKLFTVVLNRKKEDKEDQELANG